METTVQTVSSATTPEHLPVLHAISGVRLVAGRRFAPSTSPPSSLVNDHSPDGLRYLFIPYSIPRTFSLETKCWVLTSTILAAGGGRLRHWDEWVCPTTPVSHRARIPWPSRRGDVAEGYAGSPSTLRNGYVHSLRPLAFGRRLDSEGLGGAS
ncbi:hypothetical protein NMY22_g1684 [Coprinellus aureogranulatus]|nr:hypothetical protein NMY22_g1684 [Coprinellus aureogranulatus]